MFKVVVTRLLQMALHKDDGAINTCKVYVTGFIDGEKVVQCSECLI